MSNLIPEGRYQAVATRVAGEDGEPIIRFAYSGEKGTKQCLVYFKILEGEYRGQTLPWFGFFTENAWKRTIESLRYAGFKGPDLFAIEDQELDQVVSIEVEHNENPKSGDTYARIAWVNKPGAGAIKLANPMARDDLRKFAAAMRSRVAPIPDHRGERASETPSPATPTNAANGAPLPSDWGDTGQGPPTAEDDIPF